MVRSNQFPVRTLVHTSALGMYYPLDNPHAQESRLGETDLRRRRTLPRSHGQEPYPYACTRT
ncbi:MAG: hypothetical protein RSE08_06745, partial [Lactococcus sp.]